MSIINLLYIPIIKYILFIKINNSLTSTYNEQFYKSLLNAIPCGLLIPSFSQNIKILSLTKYKNPSTTKYN